MVLGAIEMMIFDDERSKWLVPYAAAFSDPELAALDVALTESVAKHLPPGAQQRRFAKALAAATKTGAIAKTSPDISKGADLIGRHSSPTTRSSPADSRASRRRRSQEPWATWHRTGRPWRPTM